MIIVFIENEPFVRHIIALIFHITFYLYKNIQLLGVHDGTT